MKTYSLIGVDSKRIELNNAEVQILEHLMEGSGISEQEALHQVVGYKREQILVQEKNHNYDLVELLLREIDEWNDETAEIVEQLRLAHIPIPKIFIP